MRNERERTTEPDRGRIVLIDPDADTRRGFADRLRAQGFTVDEANDGIAGAANVLAAPPAAVIADLWMDRVSGVQLCRLLKAEPATADVPVVLRARTEDPSNRFWATKAGAAALVAKGRMGDLVRTLTALTSTPRSSDDFFLQLSDGAEDVRDRIAKHLDRALFEAVVGAEVRALAGACSFPRLFDALSQLVSQLLHYRWLSVVTTQPLAFAIHSSGEGRARAIAEARTALSVHEMTPTIEVLDDDASAVGAPGPTATTEILLGTMSVGRLAISALEGDSKVASIASLIARELGAAIRLVTLVEESRRLATTDGLTSLYNRRAFSEIVEREIARCDRSQAPLTLLLLDLDRFKSINDTHGHAAGDAVLSAVSALLRKQARAYDVVARWGGEEFVIALPDADAAAGAVVAERVRNALESLIVCDGDGAPIPLTVSIGVAERRSHEPLDATVDAADRAMYCAKTTGRNRVCMRPAAVDAELSAA